MKYYDQSNQPIQLQDFDFGANDGILTFGDAFGDYEDG